MDPLSVNSYRPRQLRGGTHDRHRFHGRRFDFRGTVPHACPSTGIAKRPGAVRTRQWKVPHPSTRGTMRRLLSVFVAVTLVCAVAPATALASDLEIYVIDVGQGDSTLVVGPGDDSKRATLLIDAGDNRLGTNGAALVRAILELAGVEHLDHVVLLALRRGPYGGLRSGWYRIRLASLDAHWIREGTQMHSWQTVSNAVHHRYRATNR